MRKLLCLRRYQKYTAEIRSAREHLRLHFPKPNLRRLYAEYFYVLKFLEENQLISFVLDNNLEFKPIFFINEGRQLPYDDLCTKMVPYMGKKIIVRNGYEKFKKLGFRTYDQAKEERKKNMSLFIKIATILITLIGTFLTVIINLDQIVNNIKKLF